MPTGRDISGTRRGGTTKKNAFCSFCRKSYRDVGPLVECLKRQHACQVEVLLRFQAPRATALLEALDLPDFPRTFCPAP